MTTGIESVQDAEVDFLGVAAFHIRHIPLNSRELGYANLQPTSLSFIHDMTKAKSQKTTRTYALSLLSTCQHMSKNDPFSPPYHFVYGPYRTIYPGRITICGTLLITF